MTSVRNRPLRADDVQEHPLRSIGGAADPASRTPQPERERHPRGSSGSLQSLDWRQAVGSGLIGLGVVAILLAWFGVSGTLDPGEQMPYISSGGFGGSALIAIGVTLLVSFEHTRDREALRDVLAELDDVRARLDAIQPTTLHPHAIGSQAPSANGS